MIYSPMILDLNLNLVQSELHISIKQVSLQPNEEHINFKLIKYNHFLIQELADMNLYRG